MPTDLGYILSYLTLTEVDIQQPLIRQRKLTMSDHVPFSKILTNLCQLLSREEPVSALS